jgi:Flp pilus assembly secretin CpaC
MRRTVSIVSAVMALAAVTAGPALAQTLSVNANQAVRISLASPAKDVAVGNAEIADVVVMDERNILVVGKSFGTTNVVVIDRAGRMILDRKVVVTGGESGQVSLYKGPNASQYACSPRCELTEEAPAASPAP